MNARFVLSILLVVSLFIVPSKSRASDPYKILGIEKNASQREIQKAFHKMSLQYHPDKNKKKGAQEKFAEINNAYEILSDEEKRKNYDTYGDEKGDPKFDTGGAGGQGGYTHFTSGGHGNHRFRFRPNDWTYKDRDQQSEPFSFSFGGPNGGRSSGHGLDGIFSNIFMGWPNEGGHFDGFGNSANSEPRSRSSSKRIKPITPPIFEKEVADQGMTWLLLSWMHKFKQNQYYESVIEDVASSMEGALKAGSVNCESEQSLCQTLGIYLTRSPRIFVYTNREGDGASLVEYTGDLAAKSLKAFCQGHMPRFSKRVVLGQLDFSSASPGGLPRAMLLSTKKDTPTIWRVLSGLYRKRIIFYDTSVRDVSDPAVKRFGIDALPAIIGWLPDEEMQVLKAGIPVKDLKSGVQELGTLLEGFERKTRKAKRRETESGERKIPLLTKSNLDYLCGETMPVCIIGVFRTSRSRDNLESVLVKVSRKSLSRQQNQNRGPISRDSISYVLLDAGKQTSFLGAFDRFGYKSRDKFLVAYKPRKGKFATYMGEVAMEEVERFVGSVLNGDVRFNKTLQKPLLR